MNIYIYPIYILHSCQRRSWWPVPFLSGVETTKDLCSFGCADDASSKQPTAQLQGSVYGHSAQGSQGSQVSRNKMSSWTMDSHGWWYSIAGEWADHCLRESADNSDKSCGCLPIFATAHMWHGCHGLVFGRSRYDLKSAFLIGCRSSVTRCRLKQLDIYLVCPFHINYTT